MSSSFGCQAGSSDVNARIPPGVAGSGSSSMGRCCPTAPRAACVSACSGASVPRGRRRGGVDMSFGESGGCDRTGRLAITRYLHLATRVYTRRVVETVGWARPIREYGGVKRRSASPAKNSHNSKITRAWRAYWEAVRHDLDGLPGRSKDTLNTAGPKEIKIAR